MSDEDDAFAREMTSMLQVTPLKADPRGRVHTGPAQPAAHVSTPRPSATKKQAAAPPPPDIEEDFEGSFVAPGIDRRELRKLRRGDHAPVRRLDLHGMKSALAISQVKRFIETARSNCRCVAIIHGRGLNSPDHVAVLKAKVRECLIHLPGVLAFADAPKNDGGSGAVYVLLKKS